MKLLIKVLSLIHMFKQNDESIKKAINLALNLLLFQCILIQFQA
ncbi:hypothetical protein MPTP_0842 [Melissococcus plutonius ATCC 35311]|uniref:Uncharacterized protein n=1 Tax=Melissococcus plutonius (strain ATCC 35311 / DSM 29964 / CIP 104052 / LMG 20360 / NCIMB 702443) TaxID=940190 RepID=F3Y9X8_MELPT|nr:hypothetical protein MPTP_0842 [Melissococcus plutonius ATCC 35311]